MYVQLIQVVTDPHFQGAAAHVVSVQGMIGQGMIGQGSPRAGEGRAKGQPT